GITQLHLPFANGNIRLRNRIISGKDTMKQKGRDPRSPEALQAVLRRIDSMTKEEWEYWIDKLSRAPEGVYDPWSDENWPREKELRQPSKGAAPSAHGSFRGVSDSDEQDPRA